MSRMGKMRGIALAGTALLGAVLCQKPALARMAGAMDGSYWWVNAVGEWGYCAGGENVREGWYWIDGNHDGTAECYLFGGDFGYELIAGGTTPDGWEVNEAGQWTVDGMVQTRPSEELEAKYISWYGYDYGQASPIYGALENGERNLVPLIDGGQPSDKSAGAYDLDSGRLGWTADGNRYLLRNGTIYRGEWVWIGGACYYFDDSGLLARNTVTPDGWEVNQDGQWIVDGVVQTRETE